MVAVLDAWYERGQEANAEFQHIHAEAKHEAAQSSLHSASNSLMIMNRFPLGQSHLLPHSGDPTCPNFTASRQPWKIESQPRTGASMERLRCSLMKSCYLQSIVMADQEYRASPVLFEMREAGHCAVKARRTEGKVPFYLMNLTQCDVTSADFNSVLHSITIYTLGRDARQAQHGSRFESHFLEEAAQDQIYYPLHSMSRQL